MDGRGMNLVFCFLLVFGGMIVCQSCNSQQFECSDGRCIPSYDKCNFYNDCGDWSDECHCDSNSHHRVPNEGEANCDCGSDEFKCFSGLCVPLSRKCDGDGDCGDYSDENNANCPCNSPAWFECSNGRCIPRYDTCDRRYNDCGDWSDECLCGGHTFHFLFIPGGALHCACSSSGFECSNGSCLPSYNECDGYNDCGDWSDECHCDSHLRYQIPNEEKANCECRGDEFTCSSGWCIPSSLVCDGGNDCGDNSDENNPSCSCDSPRFKCSDGHCLPSYDECDGYNDCGDWSDECHCDSHLSYQIPNEGGANCECRGDEFVCSTGWCIPPFLVCDGRNDCGNWSDENIFSCPCDSSGFECSNGSCLPSYNECDGYNDCGDWSDECHCDSHLSYQIPNEEEANCECRGDEFTCSSGWCIPSSLVCDGGNDCGDNSDENNSSCSCDSPRFKCSDGHCLPSYDECDGYNDCGDWSDECHCDSHLRYQIPNEGGANCECRGDEFVCSSGWCIPPSLVCDGDNNCGDRSDENNSSCPCDSPRFKCSNHRCLPNYNECDGYNDCGDWSDECHCDSHLSYQIPNEGGANCECRGDEFTCSIGLCVPSSLVCDGGNDCGDWSDENNSSQCLEMHGHEDEAAKFPQGITLGTIFGVLFVVILVSLGTLFLCIRKTSCPLHKIYYKSTNKDLNRPIQREDLPEVEMQSYGSLMQGAPVPQCGDLPEVEVQWSPDADVDL